MSNGFLTQEEINALINGGAVDTPEEEKAITEEEVQVETQVQENTILSMEEEVLLSDIEKDLLGEIGNISMGSASTALYQLVNHKVNITTPVVTITTLREIKSNFATPNIILDVEYVSGIDGRNILMMKVEDATIIADLMMGGDGTNKKDVLTEIEVSAVQEAMNQMIGSAATSMATMFLREVNISPPTSTIWEDMNTSISDKIDEDEKIVQISFKLEIGEILSSGIMQVLPFKTAKKIVSIMMGEEEVAVSTAETVVEEIVPKEIVSEPVQMPVETYSSPAPVPQQAAPQVEVQKASFAPLSASKSSETYDNIDLILDVPLQISVVLGRTKKSIKEVLSLGSGSLIELDKLADEPVEVLVNGKTIATGEVVVIDENFGVKVTNIVSGAERVKSLR